jgi:hypothetical protein
MDGGRQLIATIVMPTSALPSQSKLTAEPSGGSTVKT